MNSADRIEGEAAAWLMRRDASGPQAEDAEFTAWLVADTRHRAAYVRLAAAWERTARLKNLRPDRAPPDADLFGPRQHSTFWPKRPQRLAIAAVLAIAAISVTWWFQQARAQIYRTDIGEMSRVILQDGSSVTLNTDSELRVRFTDRRRSVELVHGEAQFAVAHEKDRPFDVLAGRRTVRAVGTEFDVRLDHDLPMTVLVTEGRVAVIERVDADDQARSTIVNVGEVAMENDGKLSIRRLPKSDAARRLAWRNDELSFQGESLAEAVAEFNRYNRRQIRVLDPSLAAIKVGGNFKPRDIDSFLAALSRSFGITTKAAEGGSVILVRSQDFP
jgi:transmembrane sensor